MWTALRESEQVAEAVSQQTDQPPQGWGGDDRDDYRRQAREGEGDQGHQADAPRDEARDALRVDQDLADLQAGDEGRRHAGAIPLQELDQVEMRPDGYDQLGALLVGEQQRHVLADPRRPDGLVLNAQRLEPLPPGSVAVGVGMDDLLGA